MQKGLPVSILILTRNSVATIGRCLQSVAWADEILLVDAKSSDGTVALAEASGQNWSGKVRILSRPWNGFREQRNYALDQAKNDWVLVVDSDEACSEQLATRVRNILSQNPPEKAAYKVRRVEYFLGREIRYGIWNPSYQDRFFNRQGIRYINDVHEYPVFPEPPGKIEEPIHHWPGFGPEKFLDKMNQYTSIEARDRFSQGRRTNAFRLFFAFPAMFFKNYIYYKAYRDGMPGFVISVLEGVSRAIRHVKIWQLQNSLREEKT